MNYFKIGTPVIYVNSDGEYWNGIVTEVVPKELFAVKVLLDDDDNCTISATINGYCSVVPSKSQSCVIPIHNVTLGDKVEVINYYQPGVDNVVTITYLDDLLCTFANSSGSVGEIGLFHQGIEHIDIGQALNDFWEDESSLDHLFVSFMQPVGYIPNIKQKEKRYTMKKVIQQNKASAITAAKITLGKNAIKTAQKAIGPKLPMFARGYAEHPVFGILIANIFNYAIQSKFPDNTKAVMVAESMMDASMLMSAEHFDIEGIIQEFLDKLVIPANISEE